MLIDIFLQYYIVAKFAFLQSIVQRSRLFLLAFVNSFRSAMMMYLYIYTFAYVGHGNVSVSIQSATWAIAIYFIILSFGIRGIFQKINNDIKFGFVENFLNKPYNYIFYRIADQIGEGLIAPFIVLGTLCVFLSLNVGLPEFTFSMLYLVEVISVFVLGLILILLMYICVGLVAFWLEEAEPAYWVVDKLIMLLGGAYIPIALFPESLKIITEYLPFSATYFATLIFNPTFEADAIRLILVQVFWIIFFAFLTSILYNRGMKNLSVNG